MPAELSIIEYFMNLKNNLIHCFNYDNFFTYDNFLMLSATAFNTVLISSNSKPNQCTAIVP
jgi:hypothetical protein